VIRHLIQALREAADVWSPDPEKDADIDQDPATKAKAKKKFTMAALRCPSGEEPKMTFGVLRCPGK